MISEEDSDVSDIDLPDISQLLKGASLRPIKRGEIVWAKYKNLYWPALVRAIYPKKISIWYCDEPGRTFKLPLKNICNFHDAAITAKIQKSCREAGCFTEHEGLTTHAMRYLQRKAQGHKDDPMKFFDQTYPFFLAEKMCNKNPDLDVSNMKMPPIYIDNKRLTRKTILANNDESGDSEVESDDSEIESTDSDDVPEEKTSTADYVTTVNVNLQDKHSGFSKKEYDEIIKCILSGKTDDYLKKIKSKSIPSKYQDKYDKSVRSKRKNTNKVTYTGPIDDDDKLRRLIFYLLPLYKSISTPKGKRDVVRKQESISSTTCFNVKDVEAEYVASVWLPEAIIFAISVIMNISLGKAKRLFRKNSESKTKAIKSILSSIDGPLSEVDVSDYASKYGETSSVKSDFTDFVSKSGETRSSHIDDKQYEVKKQPTDTNRCHSSKETCIQKIKTVKGGEHSSDIIELSHTSLLSGDLKSDKMNVESKSDYVSKSKKDSTSQTCGNRRKKAKTFW